MSDIEETVMSELEEKLAYALDGPDAESVYECAHCGLGHEDWQDDCPKCGGVLMRIVTDARDDDPHVVG